MMKELEQIERKVFEESKRLARESYETYSEDIHERLYLYINNKELKIANGMFTSEWELAESQSIPRNCTRDSLIPWFVERIRRLPIL